MTKPVTPAPIGLGDHVKDRITGFSGIAVALTTWLNGCVRVAVAPTTLDKGAPDRERHFDASQLDVVERGAHHPSYLSPTTHRLGDRVRCSLTDFTGIVEAVAVALHRPAQLGVQAEKLVEGKPVDTQWIFTGQLEPIKRAVHAAPAAAATAPGGPPREGRGVEGRGFER